MRQYPGYLTGSTQVTFWKSKASESLVVFLGMAGVYPGRNTLVCRGWEWRLLYA